MASDAEREQTIVVPTVIPIFPLSRIVLLPGEVLPLHIFEPRYRAMVRDALGGHQVIGMVEVDAAAKAASIGVPPVEPIGCVGLIGRHHALEDGRFLLWLVGIERFAIDTELEVDTPYRQAVVTYTSFATGPGAYARLGPLIEDLRSLLPGLVDVDGEGRARIATELATLEPPQLLPLACRMVEMAPARKRQVLEAPSLAESFLIVYQDVNDALVGSVDLRLDEATALN
jgi:Lon protease-like protein